MRLNIRNVAQIRSADICIDGLTVIAGKNNTGKSTIGKTLFAIFNSFYKIEEHVQEKRKEDIKSFCRQVMGNYMTHDSLKHISDYNRQRMVRYAAVMDMTECIFAAMEAGTTLELASGVQRILEKYNIVSDDSVAVTDLQNDIVVWAKEKMQISDAKLIAEVAERYFKAVFNGQINCLSGNPKADANVTLTVKGKRAEVHFEENRCVEWGTQISLMHEAFLIDSPLVLDNIAADSRLVVDRADSVIQDFLIKKLSSNQKIMDGVIEAVIAKEKLEQIYALLEQAIGGMVTVKNNEFVLVNEQYREPVYFRNLSTGLKSFLIIKLLLEKGILKEKDVLILDEPEIHLHPEWQLLYAEIVVLLQKQFDLSIVLTTHSSQFLEALDYYSQKYEISGKCHYYLASVRDGYSEFEEVTDNLEKIYRQMVTPSILLDQLKYELNKESNDEI